jgi:hypothetical protein
MADILTAIAFAAMVWAVVDVLRLLPAGVPRVLWLIAVIAVPVLGPLYWWHIQYREVPRRLASKDSRG